MYIWKKNLMYLKWGGPNDSLAPWLSGLGVAVAPWHPPLGTPLRNAYQYQARMNVFGLPPPSKKSDIILLSRHFALPIDLGPRFAMQPKIPFQMTQQWVRVTFF